MDGNRAFERVLTFAGDFAPLLVLHALVPTLAAASGTEPRLAVALPIAMPTLEKHFMFSRQALRAGRWWTAASHMFLHANTAHALSNLQCALVAGPSATATCGVNGAMLTYIMAGVTAALDPFEFGTQRFERIMERWGVADRVRRIARACNFLGPVVEEPASKYLGIDLSKVVDGASSTFEEAHRSAVRAVAKKVQDNVRLLGASAGASAFVAIDTCVVAEALLAGWRCDHVAAALHVASSVMYFVNEWRLIESNDNIGHGAHLTGAAVGVAAFVVCRFWRRRRSRWRNYGEGASGHGGAPSSPMRCHRNVFSSPTA